MVRLAVCGSWWLLKTWSGTVGREDKIIPIIKCHLLQLLRRDSCRVPLLSTLLLLPALFLTTYGHVGQFVKCQTEKLFQ